MPNYPNKELETKVKEWLEWDKNESTLNEINQLVSGESWNVLTSIMLKRISFGTAGLRGKMCAGYANMNDLVIIQTAQGILRYLEQTDRENLLENGIVVGFDGRYNSQLWAQITAAIFLHAGYKVWLFTEVNPTPFIPFAVDIFGCAMGIMVTASHNPKEDNGYKVYNKKGSQIIPPDDKEIQKSILQNLKPWPTSTDLSILKTTDNLQDPLQKVIYEYLSLIDETIIPEYKKINSQENILFTYTAMHGVGYKFINKVFELTKLRMVPVALQRDPDPEFPTVKFPNPEEGKSSLELSFQIADQHKSNIIIANDPDADRMCVAEKNRCSGKWHIFSGNETGALLGWWMLHCYKKQNPDKPLKNVYMLASTVSSKILQTMAKREGFKFIETLTGFKWMGNYAHELLMCKKEVIFAFEEAIGFMCGSGVLDKDGITAGYQIATLASYLSSKKLTLHDKLKEIYETYGQHVTSNSYYICHDQDKIKQIFERIRTCNGGTYPKSIREGEYEIKYIRDLTTGYDDSQPDKKAVLPTSKSSQMITFTFTNGFVCTLRTSGTEPKIKYYSELCASPEQTDIKEIMKTLDKMVHSIVKEFLQPEENDLIPRSD